MVRGASPDVFFVHVGETTSRCMRQVHEVGEPAGRRRVCVLGDQRPPQSATELDDQQIGGSAHNTCTRTSRSITPLPSARLDSSGIR